SALYRTSSDEREGRRELKNNARMKRVMNFRTLRLIFVSCVAVQLSAVVLAAERHFDVVVYGGTPGGIAAAVAAGRLGRTVALVEYQDHLGGMAASGLGKSDIQNRAVIGGLFREFTERVFKHYVKTYGADSENVRLCQDGYYYEP